MSSYLDYHSIMYSRKEFLIEVNLGDYLIGIRTYGSYVSVTITSHNSPIYHPCHIGIDKLSLQYLEEIDKYLLIVQDFNIVEVLDYDNSNKNFYFLINTFITLVLIVT